MSAGVLEGFRLSPQQRSLWRLRRQYPQWPAQSLCTIRIEGELDPVRLRKALDQAWERNEILRTYFPTLSGMAEPVQAIAEAQPLPLEERSLVGLSAEELARSIERFAGEAPDVSLRPGARIEILRLTAERHLLLVAIPTFCADARTLELLAREIGELYSAALEGRDLPAASVQYADASQWLNDLLESDMAAAGRSYWKQNPTDDIAAVELPFRRSVSERTHEAWRARHRSLARELPERLDEAAARIGCARSAVLLAGLELLIWRFTGSSEFIVARGADGRRLEELQKALGPLARDLPLVCRISEAATFAEFARDIARRMAEQELWQEYWPSDLEDDRGERIRSASTPAIGFEYRELPKPVRADGISFVLQTLEVQRPASPLRMVIVDREGSVGIELEYDSSCFSDRDVQYFVDCYQTLLAGAVQAPETSIERLPILDEPQRSKIVMEFNEARKEHFSDAPLHRCFEEQVRRTPDAIAVVCDDRSLSFGEVNSRANRLARRLRGLGVGPDSVVGLLLERSLETVVALLSVWKAGGAYLPLEVSTPRERHRFMLEDAGARVLLTEERFRREFPDSPGQVFSIQEIGEDSHAEDDSDLPDGAGPTNLAYVIYTSGSTGQPKGVAIEHRQLGNYVNAIVDRLQPPAGSNFATVSTFGADLGHTAIFPSLLFGGSLHVISQERASDSEALSDYCRAHAIDYLKIVPSHLVALLSGARPEGVLPRRGLVLGGEALTWELAERIRGLAPQCQIWNHYGPTETTVGATSFEVAGSEAATSRTVPIGTPLANVQAYVLDRFLAPVPLWAPGELYVAGGGVARGYQNRPELTRERFLPDPFRPGSRMYRTGDLARFLPDGNIEWLGRSDDQVKFHGFRVELGEIEARLRQHARVAESVVLLREDAPGEKRLVAYCVLSEGLPVTDDELKAFLRSVLPEFMTPAAFVYLTRLPLTANGKVDRRALPAPDPARRDAQTVMTAPRTPVEEELIEIWKKVLRLDRIGVHDNFFHLGGDSILAIQIVARSNRAGLRLTPRQLFEHQTVAELAGVVGKIAAIHVDQEQVSGAVPLTPIQSWFFEQDLADLHHYNQSVLLEAGDPLNVEALEDTVEALLSHHDALRLRFTRRADGWEQNNAEPDRGRVFSKVDLGELDTADLPAAIEKAATKIQASLDLSDGPLARFVLLDCGSRQRPRLLFVVHHLAVDGVSWRILLEDFEAAYGQRAQGRKIELPSKTTSFRGWARLLATHMRSRALDPELPYWRALGTRELRPLPRDFFGNPNTVQSESVVSMALTAEETEALLQDLPVAYGTQINDPLLTGLLRAMSSWTGERSLLVDLEGHGREEIVEDVDLSRTVGWFTARFPLWIAAEDPTDIVETLKQVKEQLRSVPNRGIGYGLLRYGSAASEDSARLAPLPQPEISFNYLGQLDSRLRDGSMFAVAGEPDGPTRSPRQTRRHLLSVDGGITGGRLRFSWTYSEAVHRRGTIERIASEFADSLRALIAHSVSPEAGGYTPSDFPKAKLSQKALDKLVSRFES